MARHPKQVTGNLSALILAVLEEEPRHGYAIAREIESRSADALSFGEGALYPALKTLEHEGHILGAWNTENGGPARKVYELTPQGRKELARQRQAWLDYSRSIEQVLIPGKRATSA